MSHVSIPILWVRAEKILINMRVVLELLAQMDQVQTLSPAHRCTLAAAVVVEPARPETTP
jgi:hypothetical protein